MNYQIPNFEILDRVFNYEATLNEEQKNNLKLNLIRDINMLNMELNPTKFYYNFFF